MPRGRKNFSATCWFNTLCQMFLAIPRLMDFLTSLGNDRSMALVSLIYNDDESPYHFIKAIMDSYPTLKSGGATEKSQHCIIEFIPYILEYVAGDQKRKLEDLLFTATRSKRVCKRCTTVETGSLIHAPISFVNDWKSSIESFKAMRSDITAYCAKCGSETEQGMMNFRKYIGDVVFIAPMNSDGVPPTEFTMKLIGSPNPVKYELVALGHHGGNLSTGARGGHWYAFVKETDTWHKANDSSVEHSAIGENCNLAAYVRV